MWDRAHRSGYTMYWCRTTNSRRPLDYFVTLHSRGTSNWTRTPWISRKGFLRRAGFLQLLTKKRRKEIITKNLHQVALTVKELQLRPDYASSCAFRHRGSLCPDNLR